MDLISRIISLHEALKTARLQHAFGGALALAWCTERARGTIDIDINVFIPKADFVTLINGLPSEITITKKDEETLQREGQVRLWWQRTPVDIFLNSTALHEDMADRIRWETLAEQKLPFLSCQDLAVFKVFFNRTKDWADLEAMHEAGTLDVKYVASILMEYLGTDDERIKKLEVIST
jgi:hypothetical protein